MAKNKKYKNWEIVLFILSLLFVFGATGLYFSGIYLSKSFFDFGDKQKPVGVLSKSVGDIQKEADEDIAFGSIHTGSVINNYDSVLTGQNGTGTITLDDGGEIELTQNTMIRLALENEGAKEGQYRVYRVEVLSGQVKAKSQSKKLIIKNTDGLVTITKGESKTFKNVVKTPVAMRVVKPSPSPSLTPSPTPSPSPSPSKTAYKPKPIVRVFVKPSPSPSPRPSPSPSPVVKPSPSPSPSLLPFYKYVEVPLLKYPPDKVFYSSQDIQLTSEKRILFTWVFKKYMEKFDIEISTDKSFNHVVARSTSVSNFYSFKNPPKGNYWWRVRGYSQDSQSGWTDKRFFIVK
jgi:hypothetical protein